VRSGHSHTPFDFRFGDGCIVGNAMERRFMTVLRTQSAPQDNVVRRILSHSIIYSIGDLLTKAARYVLIPVYLAVLTPSEVGMLAILQATSMLAWACCCLGMGAVVRRYYLPAMDDLEERPQPPRTLRSEIHQINAEELSQRDAWFAALWWSRTVAGLIPLLLMLSLIYVFSERWYPLLPAWMPLAACCTGYLRSSTDMLESWYVIRGEPMRFRMFTLGQFLLTTTLVLAGVLGWSMGVRGVVLGEVLATFVWACVTACLATFRAKPSFQRIHWKRIVRYCWPIIPHTVFMGFLAGGDRLLLQQYVDSDDIGIYDVAYLLASVLMIVAQGLRAAWIPDFFRTADRLGGRQRYTHLTSLYCIAVLGAASAAAMFCPELIGLIGGQSYAGAVPVCRVVILGTGCFGVFIAMNQPLFLKHETIVLATFSGIGVLINLAANFVLIPRLGIMGAAWSTVAAYATMMGLSYTYTRSKMQIPWNLSVLVSGFTLLATIVFGGPWIPDNSWAGIGLKVLVLTIILNLMVLVRKKLGFVPVVNRLPDRG